MERRAYMQGLAAKLRSTAHWLACRPKRFFVVFAILLIWPMLLNSGPFYFGDSPGYLSGGKTAVDFASDRVHGLFVHANPAAAGGAVKTKVNGVRSVAYSVFAYVTRAPGDSWFGTCALQALATAFILTALFKVYGLFETPLTLIGFAALAAFATPAAWFAVLGTPDIFAGIAILAVGLLAAYPDQLSVRTKVVSAALIAFAVSAHLSHVPLVGTLVAIAAALILWHVRVGGWKTAARQFAWIAVPALIGLAATVSINAIGFKKASVTGNHFPIVLASSIQAGPARWYLEAHCATEHYAVCELYTTFPKTSAEFLWGPKGVRARASADMAERIRREEPIILKRSFAAYPVTSIKEALISFVEQLTAIGLYDHNFGSRLKPDTYGNLQLVTPQPPESPFKIAVKFFFELVQVAAIAAMIHLVVRRRDRLTPSDGTLLFLVIAGCLINAAICGALSAVTDRYQGRVVWAFIVPVAIIWWQSRSNKVRQID